MEITITKGKEKWIHSMSIETFPDKWEAFDDARGSYPNATIKVEGVGTFGPLGDSDSETSGVRGEAAPTERHS